MGSTFFRQPVATVRFEEKKKEEEGKKETDLGSIEATLNQVWPAEKPLAPLWWWSEKP